MRRTAAILALRRPRSRTRAAVVATVALAALVPVLAGALLSAVEAHPDLSPVEAPVGREVSFTLSVPVEGDDAAAVVVAVPEGVAVSGARAIEGWTVAAEGRRLRWTGGPAPRGTYLVFGFTAEVTAPAVLRFPVTVTASDGSTQHWSAESFDDPAPAPIVFAGVPVRYPGVDDGSASTPVLAAGATGAAVVTGGVVLVLARRRRRAG